jgi:NAD(P)-dependent dehydrogenase (short-subunit alcohol dehydrogenase family)
MSEGTVIVTGASRGIGAAIAAELARRGYRVAALSRSGDTPAGKGYGCDMADEAAIVRTVAEVAADEPPLVGLVNNAGVHFEAPSHALTVADFERLMRVDATAVMIACREVYPHLKAAGGGLIVNIGSVLDKVGATRSLAYCAAKAAVGAITRCLAVEWAADGIRVLDVAPGFIETDLNRDFLNNEKIKPWLQRRVPVGRPGRAEEVARLVGALFQEGIGFMTGETIYIDGAQASSVR